MNEHISNIRTFMVKAGQELPDKPTIPSEAVRILRAKLIFEEAMETIRALGVSVVAEDIENNIPVEDKNTSFQFLAKGEVDLVEVADGCADISVVTYGTLLACGVDPAPIIAEVDRTNLAKFGPGGYRREDGKWMKPPDWKPPEVLRLLREQGYES